jgi:hypothetical protein
MIELAPLKHRRSFLAVLKWEKYNIIGRHIEERVGCVYRMGCAERMYKRVYLEGDDKAGRKRGDEWGEGGCG